MTAEQFVYWLQGFAELNGERPTPEQWKAINEHLQTVFVKTTPAYMPFPGPGIRTMELRPSDWLPNFPSSPVITC
jgi:hypothetical protein